ncbi:MAG: LytTR family DNA-binding domain-containing protein [Bacteroidota bacterium]
MKKYKCLLVDDEPPAIELLQKYMSMVEQLEVIGTSHSAVKAFDLLKTQDVDLLFLDIRMPALNGLDFLKTLQNPPAVILTTAYREYALDGYDLDIVDYLLKPIAFDRFLKAIDRFQNRFEAEVIEQKETSSVTPHIFFNVNRTHHKVVLNDILYVESLKDYVRIHTVKDRLVVKGNIGKILEQLPSEQFVRIHRSYAVAVARIEAYNQTEVKVGGKTLPLGVSFRGRFLEVIE